MEEAVKAALRGSQDRQRDVSSVAQGSVRPVATLLTPQPLSGTEAVSSPEKAPSQPPG